MNSKFEKVDQLLCKALDEIVMKSELNQMDLDNLHKILSSLVMNDSLMEEEDGYSRDNYSNRAMPYMRNSYGYSNNRYSNRRSGGRYSNEYSRHDSKQATMEKLEDMLETSQDPTVRDAIMLAMNKLDK